MALTTNLIGRTAERRPDSPEIADPGGTNTWFWPSALRANLGGEYIAEIVAAWVEDGSVKVALRDPHGNIGHTWLDFVRLIVRTHEVKP